MTDADNGARSKRRLTDHSVALPAGVADDDRSPVIWLLIVAGSASTTLARVAKGLQDRYPNAVFVPIDAEGFNTRSGSTVYWSGPGTVRRFAPETTGMINFTRNRPHLPIQLNLVLNGGQFAYRRLVRRFARALSKYGPDIVLTCNDTAYPQRALIDAARLAGAPSILIQEGPFSIVRPRRMAANRTLAHMLVKAIRAAGLYPRSMPYGAYGHVRILAASADYASRFERAGADPQTIATIGVPRFDVLVSLRQQRAAQPTGDGRRRVLYLFQPFIRQARVNPDIVSHMMGEMADGMNDAWRKDAFHLVLRPHPRSDAKAVEGLSRLLNFPHEIDSVASLPDSVISSDCVIGHYSIGLLEAAALDVPIISVPIPLAAFHSRYEAAKQAWFEEAGVPSPRKAGAVAKAILSSLNDASTTALAIESETGPIDGGATARAVDEISHFVSTN